MMFSNSHINVCITLESICYPPTSSQTYYKEPVKEENIQPSRYYDDMEKKDVFKVLANETRLQILQWLKNPEVHFPSQGIDTARVGVCVGDIQKKTGLAQSTVSHYLSMLETAGLVISTRQGQSTYYRRNEEAFSEFASVVANEL